MAVKDGLTTLLQREEQKLTAEIDKLKQEPGAAQQLAKEVSSIIFEEVSQLFILWTF